MKIRIATVLAVLLAASAEAQWGSSARQVVVPTNIVAIVTPGLMSNDLNSVLGALPAATRNIAASEVATYSNSVVARYPTKTQMSNQLEDALWVYSNHVAQSFTTTNTAAAIRTDVTALTSNLQAQADNTASNYLSISNAVYQYMGFIAQGRGSTTNWAWPDAPLVTYNTGFTGTVSYLQLFASTQFRSNHAAAVDATTGYVTVPSVAGWYRLSGDIAVIHGAGNSVAPVIEETLMGTATVHFVGGMSVSTTSFQNVSGSWIFEHDGVGTRQYRYGAWSQAKAITRSPVWTNHNSTLGATVNQLTLEYMGR